jgi:hypothetical protein
VLLLLLLLAAVAAVVAVAVAAAAVVVVNGIIIGIITYVSQDSEVGIATSNQLKGPGFKSLLGKGISLRSNVQTASGTKPASY